MSSPSREHLLGYLLGALEPAEQEQVETDLDLHPTLREEMRRLEGCLGQVGLKDEPSYWEPPQGLADRTCRFVAVQARIQVSPASRLRSQAPSLSTRRFSWSDLIVAAAVLVAAASLFFPALSYSRFQSQIVACQNQLQLIGLGLHEFSELQPDRSFPGPDSSGNRAVAGVVAPLLVSGGFVESPRVFLCPSSQMIRRVASFQMPTLEDLDRATGATLVAMQRNMGGDYGYNMGYVQEEKLVRPCNSRRPDYVLIADAPSDLQPGRCSANHRGRGQNMLYEDGHVNFVVRMPADSVGDDPFHNRQGWIAAGLDSRDAVVGGSSDLALPAVSD